MSGGALVMYGQLVGLTTRHEVTLASFNSDDPVERQAVEDLRASGIEVHHVERSWPCGGELWWRRLRDATGWLHGGRPLRTLQFFEPQMQHRLDQLLSEQRFDLLQIEDNAMGNYYYRTQIPTVFTEHEVRSTLPPDREPGAKTKWIQRVLREAERQRWEEYQLAVWRRFDRVQVFTQCDATVIQSMAPDLADRVRVNPFGVDIPQATDPDREEPGTVAFAGGFGHTPNVHAALWLASEIMPRLRALRPGIRLNIIGANPTRAVQALASEDIAVRANVPAVEPFLERAAVVLAPVRTGGGMRVKVLQAMALGKAVVTTPLGAEGLAVTESQPPIVVAKDADEIARMTAALLAADDTRRALGRRARAYAAEHFSWAAYGRRLEEIYSELQASPSIMRRRAGESVTANTGRSMRPFRAGVPQ
jgi:glycosyltransferase involved in cell wall biosynthesis